MVFIAAASWGLITAATPLLAGLGSHILALMTFFRFLMGLTQGEQRRSRGRGCRANDHRGDGIYHIG